MLGPRIKVNLTRSSRRRNINILGTGELRWTGLGEFNSDDQYIYYCGQESHRRNGIVLRVNKRVWNVVCGCNLKNDRMISVCFQGKPFNITVIQVYAPTTRAEEAEVDQFYEDPEELQKLTPRKMSYSWSPQSRWMVAAAMKLKDTCSLEEKQWQN